jgi:hypothetical protein
MNDVTAEEQAQADLAVDDALALILTMIDKKEHQHSDKKMYSLSHAVFVMTARRLASEGWDPEDLARDAKFHAQEQIDHEESEF